MNRTAIIRCIVLLLACLLSDRSCLAAQAADAQAATDDNAQDAPARPRRADVAWPWKTDADFLAKRSEAIEQLGKYGRLRIEHSKSERKNWLVRTFEGTPTDDILKRTLPFIPDLKRIEIDPKEISAEGLSQLSRLKYLDELLLNACREHEERRVVMTQQMMRHIGENTSLRLLVLIGCTTTDDQFAELASLQELKSLWIRRTGLTAKCFRTIAKWPKIKYFFCQYENFDQPIDRETYEAIASLNGRLEYLHFGEWDAMALHPSLIPAIAEIKSITHLWIGDVSHMTAAQLEPLGTLPNVTNFNYDRAREKEHRAIFSQIRRNAAESLRKKKEAEEGTP